MNNSPHTPYRVEPAPPPKQPSTRDGDIVVAALLSLDKARPYFRIGDEVTWYMVTNVGGETYLVPRRGTMAEEGSSGPLLIRLSLSKNFVRVDARRIRFRDGRGSVDQIPAWFQTQPEQ